MIHQLKTWPAYFSPVAKGRKTFDVRRNDRDFKTGDELHLKEYDPSKDEYTGRIVAVEVTFILYGGSFGIDKNHCVMGIKLI